MKKSLPLFTLALALSTPLVNAAQPSSYYQGLISFRDGPDPAGKTPVYWATSQKLHHVLDARAAQLKFGTNWVSQIRWCGDSSGHPLPGECSDIYYNFGKGNPVTEYTQDLLHP